MIILDHQVIEYARLARLLPLGLFLVFSIHGQFAFGDGEYFDAQHPPTREQLLEIMRIPDQDSGSSHASTDLQPNEDSPEKSLGDLTPQRRKSTPFFDINIPFRKNEARLNHEARQLLGLIGDVMQTLPAQRFTVEGHTDNKGNPQYNLALSLRRAESARSYLVDNFDIEPARIKAMGKGANDPIDPDDPSSERNRSVRVITSRD